MSQNFNKTKIMRGEHPAPARERPKVPVIADGHTHFFNRFGSCQVCGKQLNYWCNYKLCDDCLSVKNRPSPRGNRDIHYKRRPRKA